MTWGRVSTTLMLFGFSLVMLGCGDNIKRVRVSGTVTAGGDPVDNATVIFTPIDNKTKGEGAIARTDSTGKYLLMGSREGDIGIAPGEYRVRITRTIDEKGNILPKDSKQADFPDARESIPGKYCTEDTKMTINVTDVGGEIDIKIPEKLVGKK